MRPTRRRQRGRDFAPRVIGALVIVPLVAAGCTSRPQAGPAGPTASTSAGGAGSLADLAPDAFTPLTVEPISQPTFPFPGTDQKFHLAFDVQVTNATAVPASLERVDVVDAQNVSNVLLSLTGPQLVDPACEHGDCNRLRLLPSARAADAAIPPRESRSLLIDFALDSPDQFPKAVMLRLRGAGATGPAAKEPAPIDTVGAPFDISAGTPRVISPPLRGDNWVALNGCCDPGWPHRDAIMPVNMKLNNSQRFAIDWKRVNDQGEFYTGEKTDNHSYADYASPVYAVADGTVVSTLDDVDASVPGVLPATDPALAAKLTVRNVDGNHVVLDIGGGAYAMYAHLIKGSLLVKPGDKVTRGQQIANLGNSGNSNAPHLHFQLMSGPSFLGADGLPYVFDSFEYQGQVAQDAMWNADDYLSGSFFGPGRLPDARPRAGQLPLRLAIVNFP